jgi:hypothetical protein
MKFRKKDPIEITISNDQVENLTFKFDLINFVPRHEDIGCCSFCPYDDICQDFPDPRDPYSSLNFLDFCAAMDEDRADGDWVLIPVPETVERWLKELKDESQKERTDS